MATTQRGIYYLTQDDDSELADLTTITQNIADSVEDAMDEEAATVIPGRIITDSAGYASVSIPVPPDNKRWSITTGVENRAGTEPALVHLTMVGNAPYFFVHAKRWLGGAWVGMLAEVHYCARLVPAPPGGTTN